MHGQTGSVGVHVPKLDLAVLRELVALLAKEVHYFRLDTFRGGGFLYALRSFLR